MKSSKSDSSVKSESKKPWWKKGIFSETSPLGKWLHRFFALFSKREDVSESKVFLHNWAMSEIRILGKSAELIDNEKFGKEEFLIFVKIKYKLSKNMGECAGLDESVKLLQLAIDAKDSFITIDQTEFRYRGGKQQDFYLFTDQLLLDYGDTTNFRQTIQVKLADTIPTVKTEEGRTALQNYSQHLDRLSEHQLGLRLLSLFKAYHLADYSILRRISDLIQGLDKYDLCTYTPIINLVKANYSDFEKLQKIINLPSSKSNPETYALMSQVIALGYIPLEVIPGD